MTKTDDQTMAEIIKMYQNGDSPTIIGEKFGRFPTSILKSLRRRGIPLTQGFPKVSLETRDKIVEAYRTIPNSEILAVQFNINSSTVLRILKENSVDTTRKRGANNYQLKKDYFKIIDTPEKAYFLGFLYADGTLSSKENTYCIRITLHPQDRDILEHFSNIIYGFVNLKNDGNYIYLAFYCKEMWEDLCNLGCEPRKTFTITFPLRKFSDDLMSHFIRGYFDGDGCLSLANPNRPVFDITSNMTFLTGMLEFLSSKLDITFNKLSKKKDKETSTRSIQVSKNEDLKKILNYLYPENEIFFSGSRKREKCQEFFRLDKNKINKKLAKYSDIKYYGTSYIPSYEDNQLTKSYLESLSNEEKKKIAEYLFYFYRNNGFPHTKLSNNELIKKFVLVQELNIKDDNNILLTHNNNGLEIVKNFSPHFNEVVGGNSNKPSMISAFNDDNKLKKVIMNRLVGNYNISGNMIRQGLCNSHVAFKASSFNIGIAKFIYNKYVCENGIIYDYSMGFGHRLLAALSLPFKVKYIGVDPCEKTYQSNLAIYNFYNENVPGLNKEVDLRNCGSENMGNEYIGQVDLAFSSPPYFNQEIYENNPTQAYYNNDYQYFMNQWWMKTMENIDKMLKPHGIFILNIKDAVGGFNLAAPMLATAKNLGYQIIDIYQMQLSKNPNFKNKTGILKYEPIYILKK